MSQVLLLGDPRLKYRSEPVTDFADPAFHDHKRRLHETLSAFREEHGYGRAVSAPQIGVRQRFIALVFENAPRIMVNPEVTWTSPETFTMWDDCMSLPGIMIRVRRFRSLSLRFQDDEGEWRVWRELPLAHAELIQHEIDHLDGILATDRAIGRDPLVLRPVFEAMRDYFAQQVEYTIG